MSNRRVFLDDLSKINDRILSEADGMAGEVFDTEVYQPYGFSSNPDAAADAGPTILHQINDDPDNHLALPPSGDRLAKLGTTLVHYGNDVEIELSSEGIKIKAGGSFLNISNGALSTNLNIITSGTVRAADVVAGTPAVSLRTHTHVTPSGLSGIAQ